MAYIKSSKKRAYDEIDVNSTRYNPEDALMATLEYMQECIDRARKRGPMKGTGELTMRKRHRYMRDWGFKLGELIELGIIDEFRDEKDTI